MKLTRRDFLTASLAVGASLALPRLGRATQGPSVLTVGWDGADYRTLKRYGDLFPTLSSLNLVRLDCAGCTQTKPGWVELLTGIDYDMHRVLDNEVFQEVPLEWTIFHRLAQAYEGEYYQAAIFSKQGNTGDAPGKPWQPLCLWATDPELPGMDFYRNARIQGGFDLEKTNRLLGQALLELTHPAFVFCHYKHPDCTGHEFGMDSEEYLADLILLDASLKATLEAEPWDVVIVCSDHGFNGPGAHGHRNAPDGFVASNLPLMENGVRRDVAYTVTRILGLPLEGFDPPLRGKDLRL